MHMYETSDVINHVLNGKSKAICNGQEEILTAGICHIRKKDSENGIINTGSDDLAMLTVVAER